MNSDLPTLNFYLRFEKTGPIRFISHLDLTRAFHRAFARAAIPLKFSEGFSPHPKFSFALPLSVGTESVCEWASFTTKAGFVMTPDEMKDALQKQMPSGILIQKVISEAPKFSEIAFARYAITLPCADPTRIFKAEKALTGEVLIQKKNKKGKTVEKDIAPAIQSLSFLQKGDGVEIDAVLAVGEDYLKPELLLQALSERLPEWDLTKKHILRREVLLSDLSIYGA